jgi:hypothetical protein
MTPADRATVGAIVTRFPGLTSAVHTQVTRLLAAVLPAGDGAIATEDQLDALLESVVARIVAGSGTLRADPPTETDELVDTMVLLLARNSVAQARPGVARTGGWGEAELRLTAVEGGPMPGRSRSRARQGPTSAISASVRGTVTANREVR